MYNLLVVDDEPVNAHVLAVMLKQAGYNCTTAYGGEEAWQCLSADPAAFTVVISDRMMPRFDGLKLLEHMQADERLQLIPMIMQTGLAEKEEHIDCIKAGVFDFIYKPIEKPLLLGVVKRAIKVATA